MDRRGDEHLDRVPDIVQSFCNDLLQLAIHRWNQLLSLPISKAIAGGRKLTS